MEAPLQDYCTQNYLRVKVFLPLNGRGGSHARRAPEDATHLPAAPEEPPLPTLWSPPTVVHKTLSSVQKAVGDLREFSESHLPAHEAPDHPGRSEAAVLVGGCRPWGSKWAMTGKGHLNSPSKMIT